MQIAQAAFSAAGDQRLLLVRGQVRDQFAGLGVGDDRAHGNAQHDVLRALAVLVRAAPVLAAPGAVDARIAVIDERVDVAVGHCVNAAAVATVAAVRAAAGHELLPPEMGDPVPALAGVDFDPGFVDEFHGRIRVRLARQIKKPYRVDRAFPGVC